MDQEWFLALIDQKRLHFFSNPDLITCRFQTSLLAPNPISADYFFFNRKPHKGDLKSLHKTKIHCKRVVYVLSDNKKIQKTKSLFIKQRFHKLEFVNFNLKIVCKFKFKADKMKLKV